MVCQILLHGSRLENKSEFEFVERVLADSGTDGGECCRKGATGRKVANAIRSLVNAGSLQLECARMLHEALLVSALQHSREKKIWKKKECSKVRAVQMDKFTD